MSNGSARVFGSESEKGNSAEAAFFKPEKRGWVGAEYAPNCHKCGVPSFTPVKESFCILYRLYF